MSILNMAVDSSGPYKLFLMSFPAVATFFYHFIKLYILCIHIHVAYKRTFGSVLTHFGAIRVFIINCDSLTWDSKSGIGLNISKNLKTGFTQLN